MKKLLFIFSLLLVQLLAIGQMLEPIKWDVKSSNAAVAITLKAESGWHIYDMQEYDGGPSSTKISFVLPQGVTLDGEVSASKSSHIKFDEAFMMNIGTYDNGVVFTQKLNNSTASEQTITVVVEWQACDDTNCIAPTDEEFTVKIQPSTGAAVVAEADEVAEAVDNAVAEASASDVAEGKGLTTSAAVQSGEEQGSKSLWSVIVEAILWGFAALLTPCVFPMVPMTVSFFIKGSGSKARGRFMAMVYGVSIVALYTLPIAVIIAVSYFGGGEAVTADIFNWLATHWVPNILFFLIFMVFAASFFGAFEITMPSKLVNKSDAKADKGGLMGVFFMAMTLVLVSFSCTGPIVGTILVKSTQGEVWEPIITMLAFSAAFALPFTLFALFPSLLKNMPKSGGWLNSVKVVLGFIELALGLKFLSVADQTYHWGLLDREVYLALWIVIFTLLGFYLLGKLRFAHDSKTEHVSVKRLFFAICSFAFVVYMIPGMWGAPLKALSGYLPPVATMDFNLTSVSRGGGGEPTPMLDYSKIEGGKPKHSEFLHLPHGLEGFFNYEQGMDYAKKVGKPVFLGFTGHGCVNCREMEANVWSDAAVHKIMSEDYVIIALYVDDKKELEESEWVVDAKGRSHKSIGKINAAWQIEKFGINAQPYYVLIDPITEEIMVSPRSYDLSVSGFIEFLESGLRAFEK